MINRLLNILIVVALSAGAIGVWHLLDRPVQTVRITSDLSDGERSQIEDLLSRERLGGILSFDIDELRQMLTEMGWAREIYIRRQWPAAVEITLLREQPIARWSVGHYVTASSQVVALPDQYPDLPRFDVELSNPQQTLRVFSLIDRMVNPSGLELTQLKQNAQGEWQVSFAQGFHVMLGVDRLNERLIRFLKVYNSELSGTARKVAYVDVRYASGAAVKFIEPEILVASRSTSEILESEEYVAN